jgi:DNA-binding transcriptional ArsR family regulator
MAMSKQDKNTAVLTALNHPIRRQILRYLENNNNGGVSPKKLSENLNQPLGNVAYHIRILAESGVVKLATTKPRRGAVEHFYKRAGNAIDKKATEMLDFIGKD